MNKNSYAEFAAEAVHLKREALIAGEMLAGAGQNRTSDDVPGTKKYRYFAVACVGGLFLPIFLIKRDIDPNVGLALMLGSGVGLAYSMSKLHTLKLQYLEHRYKDALAIYGLVKAW